MCSVPPHLFVQAPPMPPGSLPAPKYTVKKGYRFSLPQPGCHLPNSPWTGNLKLFPARESLVSDIPAGEGKINHFFYSVIAPSCHENLTSSSLAHQPDHVFLGKRRKHHTRQPFTVGLHYLCVTRGSLID
jgi:hypothetical protein